MLGSHGISPQKNATELRLQKLDLGMEWRRKEAHRRLAEHRAWGSSTQRLFLLDTGQDKYVSYFSVAVIKHHNERQLKEELLWLAIPRG